MSVFKGMVYYKEEGGIEEIEIDTTSKNLEKFQKIVEGYIELVEYGKHLFIVNEDGYIKNLPFNDNIEKQYGQCFVGNVIVLPIEFLVDF